MHRVAARGLACAEQHSVLGLLDDVLDGDLVSHTYLVAGPPAMAEGVSEALKDAGIPEERILSDGFSGY